MMTTSGTALLTTPTETQILITRHFAARKHLVFRAWTTPELIRRWWSGHRGTVTSADVDLRVGGQWRYVMRSEAGMVGFHGEFREIVPDERLIYTEIFEGMDGVEPSINTATFTEVAGRTTLTLLSDFGSREVRDMVIASGMEAGMQEAMDELELVAVGLAS